tara:strand:+ start:3878 stop:4330 length:453 start_codon:yes stop_codon:yes gene_type:complete
MELILTSNIKKLGKIGDIVSVKAGYARNYLIPNNKAIRKTSENLKKLEEKRKEIEEKELLLKNKALEIIEKLKNIALEFSKEADDNGQLYGAIQPKEILFAIKEKSIELNADNLIIRKQIRTVGEHEIEVNPYHELSTKVKVLINSTKKE